MRLSFTRGTIQRTRTKFDQGSSTRSASAGTGIRSVTKIPRNTVLRAFLVPLRLLSRPVRVYDLPLLLAPHREGNGQVHSWITRHEAAVVARVQWQLRPRGNPDIERPQDPHDSNAE